MSDALIAKRRDKRPLAIAVAIVAVAGLGFLFAKMPRLYHVPEVVEPVAEQTPAKPPVGAPTAEPAQVPRVLTAPEAELKQRFTQAAMMLHAGRYEYAIAPLERVLELAPDMPEAYVNMGFALIGLERFGDAANFFNAAIELRPEQTNAYYGMGVALEGAGDVRGAISAMNLFTHLAEAGDPYRRKAEAALWEWNEQLRLKASEKPAEESPAPETN